MNCVLCFLAEFFLTGPFSQITSVPASVHLATWACLPLLRSNKLWAWPRNGKPTSQDQTLWGPLWAIGGHHQPSLIRDTTAHLPGPSSRTSGPVGTGPSFCISSQTEPQSLLPSPLIARLFFSCAKRGCPPMVQPQSLEDSENGGQLGARAGSSLRFHHCLNKIKKMRF